MATFLQPTHNVRLTVKSDAARRPYTGSVLVVDNYNDGSLTVIVHLGGGTVLEDYGHLGVIAGHDEGSPVPIRAVLLVLNQHS